MTAPTTNEIAMTLANLAKWRRATLPYQFGEMMSEVGDAGTPSGNPNL
jgi:hypothetical protein